MAASDGRGRPAHLKCSGCQRDLPGSRGTVASLAGTLKCSKCHKEEAKRQAEMHYGGKG